MLFRLSLLLLQLLPSYGLVAQASSQDQEERAERIGGAGGFFDHAFRQARRLGEAINRDAVAQVEQAWKVRNVPARKAAHPFLVTATASPVL